MPLMRAMSNDDKVDFGSIQIDRSVLADLAFAAIGEVAGANLKPKELRDGVLEFFGKKSYPGITVRIGKDNQVAIEVKICVAYGINIPAVARDVQEMIQTKIEQATDITIKDVNVIIHGIERGTT